MKLRGIAFTFSLLVGAWLQPTSTASVTTATPHAATPTNKPAMASLEGVLIDKNCSYDAETRVVHDHLEGGMFNAYIHEKSAC